MPYYKLFYHCIWTTKNRAPIITAEIEPFLLDLIRRKATLPNANVFAINGWVDPVHLLVSLPPKRPVSLFIGQVKGVSSVRINQSGRCETMFRWQEEYGVLSFAEEGLPVCTRYIENQKFHHGKKNGLIPRWEKTG
jgi:putative transposase